MQLQMRGVVAGRIAAVFGPGDNRAAEHGSGRVVRVTFELGGQLHQLIDRQLDRICLCCKPIDNRQASDDCSGGGSETT